ncbi:hypothetical protein N9F08_01300 [bacterium]|nr:hypothetical protein [bacterium]
MKTSLLTLSLLFLSSFTSYSQDYYHGLGVQGNIAIFSSIGSTEASSIPGIVYKATLVLTDGRGPNFAVSAYPFAGLNLNFNSQSGGSGSFGAELPILGEVYFGDADDACFFMGAGFSYAFMSYSDAWGGTSGSILGPQVGIGGQFEIAGRLLGLKAAYTLGVNRPEFVNSFTGETYRLKKNMFSGSIYYLLGQ